MQALVRTSLVTAQTLTILVVDDNDGDRFLHAKYLAKAESEHKFLSVEASSGAQALEIVAEGGVDCVLLDYYLPGETGVDLIAELRAAAGDALLPVILLTGKGDESTAVAAMRHGANDYIAKSKASSAVLTRAIENAVEKSGLKRLVEKKREILDVTNRELKQRNAEIREFYQTVSHELKTPVTAIREYNSLILEEVCGDISEQQRDFLTRSLTCCDRLTRMINDLLDAARIETAKMQIDPQMIDPNRLLRECVDGLRSRAAERGVTLHCQIDTPLPDIHADADRVAQIVNNLVTNAIKHTEQDGSVTVCARSVLEDEGIDIDVTDTGCGIAEEYLDNIFDRYFQVRSNPEDFVDGLGIGLYLSSALAALHGGYINVRSKLREGSTFTLHLPKRARSAAA